MPQPPNASVPMEATLLGSASVFTAWPWKAPWSMEVTVKLLMVEGIARLASPPWYPVMVQVPSPLSV